MKFCRLSLSPCFKFNRIDEDHLYRCPPIKLLTNNLLSSWNEAMVFGGNLPNQTLVDPFKVVRKALHRISSGTPWRCMVVLNVTRISRPIIRVNSWHLELWGQRMTCDRYHERWIDPMDEIDHVMSFSHGILHLFHGFFNQIHFLLQVRYSSYNNASWWISFSAILCPYSF